MSDTVIPVERIERVIYLIRGQKVMLDRDLAVLYGVETRALKQAVKRNEARFPADFMFVFTTVRLKTPVNRALPAYREFRRLADSPKTLEKGGLSRKA